MIHLRSSTPLARKPHQCAACGRGIARGERYAAETNVGDDGVYTIRLHTFCDRVFRHLLKVADLRDYDGHGFDPMEVLENEASEHLGVVQKVLNG